jgi:predicted  nucleic acid-binding Zn-ribbon protein
MRIHRVPDPPFMNPDLEKLIRLHHAESQLGHVESDLAEIPERRRALEERVSGERSRLDAALAALDESQKTRRQLESEVQDLEAKRSRYKSQLMEVKTNKEYTAMLHEIEGVEREIRGREDRILEEMERAETLGEDVASEESAFREVEHAVQGERAELDAREKQLDREREKASRERDDVASSIPDEPLHLYQRVAKLRGTAVAEARDGLCQTCHVKLRLQMWVDLRHNETIFQCPSCNRILYYEPPPPTVVAEP